MQITSGFFNFWQLDIILSAGQDNREELLKLSGTRTQVEKYYY